MIYLLMALGGAALFSPLFAGYMAFLEDRTTCIKLLWLAAILAVSSGVTAVVNPSMFSAEAVYIKTSPLE